MYDLLAAPATTAPNWATIMTAFAAVAGLLAAYRGARYAVRQYELAVGRDRREQAAKVAFWAEVDNDTLQIKYINTSGLPVWDVLVRPAGAAGPNDRYREFVLGPSERALDVGPVWGWAGGPISGLLESQQQAWADISASVGRIGDLSSITGGWKRLQAPTQKATVRLDRARLSVDFTDAAGVRWNRDATGQLRATNLPQEPTAAHTLRRVAAWFADGLRDGSASHGSSKS